MPKVREAINEIKNRCGADKFSYHMFMDEGRTGRLEATVYKNQSASCEGQGELVWSKAQSGQFPSADFENFCNMVSAAIQ